ncbi:50S ribosomal protein L33 [Cohnella lubricantis]|uniref:50S ribosomal protein L33 n=1 Tax=Cohnella lubricantis TaxID=2163172 RepID=A0A841TIY9_9BACL|nr:50S ribosomal protein L33 [Cohnella lubricantis]MBB6678461.1 50S ribosomal protein L33 [Cohnella lubricantis]MBP2116841.1 hypothetical protein [Cohnella lubricantis]
MSRITREQALKFVGKQVYALRKDGTQVSGRLVRVSGSRLVLSQQKGRKASTKAILPLALFDVLAIGTAPFAYGGYGPWGYGGYGGYGWGGGFGWW